MKEACHMTLVLGLFWMDCAGRRREAAVNWLHLLPRNLLCHRRTLWEHLWEYSGLSLDEELKKKPSDMASKAMPCIVQCK